MRSLPKRWVQAKSSSSNNRGLVGMKLIGVGSCAPKTIVSNDDLAKLVDTNDEWIASRTGIKRRHILGKGETLSSLAQEASLKALEMAGLRADEVDLILYATSSPDDLFGGACQVSVLCLYRYGAHLSNRLPPSDMPRGVCEVLLVSDACMRACMQLQALIGAKNAVGFDITAACSGFVLALVTAAQYIRTGTFKRVLVVGADALSRFVDWRDRCGCPFSLHHGQHCSTVPHPLSLNVQPRASCLATAVEQSS